MSAAQERSSRTNMLSNVRVAKEKRRRVPRPDFCEEDSVSERGPPKKSVTCTSRAQPKLFF